MTEAISGSIFRRKTLCLKREVRKFFLRVLENRCLKVSFPFVDNVLISNLSKAFITFPLLANLLIIFCFYTVKAPGEMRVFYHFRIRAFSIFHTQTNMIILKDAVFFLYYT